MKIVPQLEGRSDGLLREQMMVILPRVVSMLNCVMERACSYVRETDWIDRRGIDLGS